MHTSTKRHLLSGLGILFIAGSTGCLASDATGARSDEDVQDNRVDSAATVPPPPLGCIGGVPTGGDYVPCYYDAPQLEYTDSWKCTPPGDPIDGRCKTTIVGKSVSLTFFTQQHAFVGPGVSFCWRPSNAQGSARVLIDGVDVGLVWQGEDSPGCKSYVLAPGPHRIQLMKPARDGDRAIGLRYFTNDASP